MDFLTILLAIYLGWIIGKFIIRSFLPKPDVCTSELIWHRDANPNANKPDLEKDFDVRFEACLLRIKMQLPLFELESHKKAILDILNQQKLRLTWILNELEKTMKVKCIFILILPLKPDKAKNLLFKICLNGETIEGKPINLSHKDIMYKIDLGGNVETL